jgi:hypothetical protein
MNPVRRALGHLYSCKEATRIVSQAQERPLSLIERWKLSLHLGVCEACSRFERQIRFLREALDRFRS